MTGYSDPPAIRRAVSGDAPALARLRYRFRAELARPTEEEESFVARCSAWMAARLREESPWLCWIAERDGRPVGNLWLRTIDKIPNPVAELEIHAYITSVYVEPSARGGVGEALLDAALGWCRRNGVDSAILWPTARSERLYARHGFAFPTDLMQAVIHPGRATHGDA